jgi:hypothetical protein
VYKEDGGAFDLSLAAGTYNATWVDTRTGARQSGSTITSGGSSVQFFAPTMSSDWVLILRNAS